SKVAWFPVNWQLLNVKTYGTSGSLVHAKKNPAPRSVECPENSQLVKVVGAVGMKLTPPDFAATAPEPNPVTSTPPPVFCWNTTPLNSAAALSRTTPRPSFREISLLSMTDASVVSMCTPPPWLSTI